MNRIVKNRIVEQDIIDIYNCGFINWNDFKGKSVLITGATGLIGSQLTCSLVYANEQANLNIKLILLTRSKRKARFFFEKTFKHTKVAFLKQDITKKIRCGKKIDYIIHCANNTSSESFVKTPIETIETIVNGTKNILEFAVKKRVKGVVYLSSMEVYGQINSEKEIKEDEYGYIDISNPRSSYSEGKRLAECLCNSYCREFNCPVKIARLAQVIGANADYNDTRVVYQFARSIIEKKDIVLYTSGDTVRSYCYITDAVTAILTILLKGQSGETYNVANDESYSIKEVAKMLTDRYIDSSLRFELRNAGYYPPDTFLKLNISKIKNLGWLPSIHLKVMLSHVIDSFFRQKLPNIKTPLAERLFSIKDRGGHKQITFCGIRIKLRLANFYRHYIKKIRKKSEIEDNKIVLSHFAGKGYSCNPKYITEEIIKRKLPYKIIWLIDKKQNAKGISEIIECIPYNSKRALFELLTAKCWIFNCSIYDFIKRGINTKNEKQIYIQTWHGALGIKRFYRSTGNKIVQNQPKLAKGVAIDNKMVDIWISNSDFETEVYKQAFWNVTEEKIKMLGHPRNDIFFKDNSDIKKKVRDYCRISSKFKILLYVPSFRDNLALGCYCLDIPKLLSFLNASTGDSWIALTKFHPRNLDDLKYLVHNMLDIIDVSLYPDIQELLVTADICVTDYSSCIFDFMLSEKPGFIFASDIEQYNNERGFYYPLEDTPFPIATTTDELIENIKNFNLEEYKIKVREFIKSKGCIDDGHASERVVDLIEKLMSGEEEIKE
ncbi:MAG: CDP-glycerol glycerophosphotransferase family protein [Holosporales bacterium]|jgi:CDP-glycerol glycerophosphotransferase|nr:CDP-glycerol glycerophosphotransferase family protein [Holosporales bacterium]